MLLEFDLENIISMYIVPWSINIGLALTLFVLGRLVAKGLVKFLERLLTKAKVDSGFSAEFCLRRPVDHLSTLPSGKLY